MALPLSERRVRDVELRLLAEGVRELRGCDLRGLRPGWLERAAVRRVRAERLPGLAALLARVLRDRAALRRLLADVFPGGRGLLEDAAFCRAFRARVVPRLRTYPSPRLWVPSCAGDGRAAVLAAILDEEGLGGRVRLYATAECDPLLEEAREGRLPGDPARLAAAWRSSGGRGRLSRWFRRDGPSGLVLLPSVASRILWGTHSLASDDSLNEFQAIVSSGALARSGPELRRRSLDLFHRSLVSFGFLGLARGDSLADSPHRDCYAPVPGSRRLYRRAR